MKRFTFNSSFRYFSLFISLGFILLLFVATACKPQKTSSGLEFLHVEGHDMVTESGQKVLFKGVGLGNWFLPEGYMWKFGNNGDRPRKIEKVVSDLIGEEKATAFWKEFHANYITEADIIRMKELGFTVVRPALNSRLFLTEDSIPQFVDEGFTMLDNLVKWCKKHEMYVIIDMHGAPGGQTGQNIDDSRQDLPELFMETRHQDDLVKLWLKIVDKYKDEPTVAGYDLLNEPLPNRTGASKEYGNMLVPLYQRLTTEIRKIDKKHMITLEGSNWANDWSHFSKPFDDNTFYQFHFYCWNYPDNLNDISYFLKKRDTLNTPIWVGETGEKNDAIYFATTQYFEKNNVGWSFWPWKKMDTQNTPYSVNKPANWDQISAYTRDGNKPSAEIAEKAFNELLENIKLGNCKFYEDVTNAIFRRVPLKIEAENYLPGDFNETWFIHDTTQNSKFYRVNEKVPVELIQEDSVLDKKRWNSEQCIMLQEDEWVKYAFNVVTPKDYQLTLRLKAIHGIASVQINVNDKEYILDAGENNWSELNSEKISLKSGENSFILKALSDSTKIDWISIN